MVINEPIGLALSAILSRLQGMVKTKQVPLVYLSDQLSKSHEIKSLVHVKALKDWAISLPNRPKTKIEAKRNC